MAIAQGILIGIAEQQGLGVDIVIFDPAGIVAHEIRIVPGGVIEVQVESLEGRIVGLKIQQDGIARVAVHTSCTGVGKRVTPLPSGSPGTVGILSGIDGRDTIHLSEEFSITDTRLGGVLPPQVDVELKIQFIGNFVICIQAQAVALET